MIKEEYQPNSHKYHEDAKKDPTDQHHDTRSKKPTVRERKTISQRFKDSFFADTFKSVAEYFVWDVLVPTAKDMIIQFVEVSLFGKSGSHSYRRSDSHRPTTRYDRVSRSSSSYVRTRSSRSFSIERFEFDTRSEAEDVLAQMNDHCKKYDGICPVSSFYDFIECDRPNDWTHDKWGWSWSALSKARVIRKSNGWYALSMPEPDTFID